MKEGGNVTLAENAHHYLRNVLRVEVGQSLRLFNGQDGEFVARVSNIGKKAIDATIEKQLRAQQNQVRAIHLLFAPLKKERMDFLIEKAVELGATHLHPVLTQNSDVRKINEDRIHAQIIEAAEQCERLDLPLLSPAKELFAALAPWDKNIPVLTALERCNAPPMNKTMAQGDVAILIGPAGGFSPEEMEKLPAMSFVRPVSLGGNILRAETAALTALGILAV